MFPATHVYVIERLIPSAGPLHRLGAVFPDAVLTNGLPWARTHCSGAGLYAFLKQEAPATLPFAVGVISHGCLPQGLDYYTDEQYGTGPKGYAFQQAEPYAERVARICHLPASMGLWKAHNFVEMAVEWLIVQRNPGLGERIREAFRDLSLLAGLADPLGRFYECDGDALLCSLPAMLPFLALEQANPQVLAERYQRQVQVKHGVKGIDLDAAAALIEEIAAAIQPECWTFLEDVLGRIGEMLREEV
ncbi:MAG: hypothetical protein ACP5SI_06855 [Chloroflexia bacterium]